MRTFTVVFRVFRNARFYYLYILKVCFKVVIGKVVRRPARLAFICIPLDFSAFAISCLFSEKTVKYMSPVVFTLSTHCWMKSLLSLSRKRCSTLKQYTASYLSVSNDISRTEAL